RQAQEKRREESGVRQSLSVGGSLFQRRQRDSDARVVARRIVVEPAALIILAVGAEAVEQVAVLRRPIDERVAGEQIKRDLRQILGGQRVEFCRVLTLIRFVGCEGEGEVEVALHLLRAVVCLLYFLDRRHQQAE